MSGWFTTFFLLLLVLDPLGNVPFFSAIMRHVDPVRRPRVILRECAIATVLLIGFLAVGESFLKLLGLSQSSLGIAGGIILILIAIRMIFDSADKMFGGEMLQGEPFIVPMAVPFLAGPSALATVILVRTNPVTPLPMAGAVLAVIAAMTVTSIILLLGMRITRLLGERGVEAMQRLMGLLLTTIAVEMFLRGIVSFTQSLK